MNELTDVINTTLAWGLPGGTEWIILLIIGLLVFGRRLPEVGRSIGRSIVEFKKGIKGIEDEIDDASTKPAPRVTDEPSPRLTKQTQPQDVSEAKVGGEGDNPYRPEDEPADRDDGGSGG